MLKLSFGFLGGMRTRTLLYYLLVVGGPLAFFLWRLGSQTPGLSQAEAALRSQAKLSNILDNPINLPYKLFDNLFYHSGLNHVWAMRLTSVFFGMVLVSLFFYVLKGWFGKPIALLTTLLFALTPLYLLSSRTATGNIMQASLILILAAYYYFWQTERTYLPLLFLVGALAICLYAPGLVWLILIGLIFLRQKLIDVIRDVDKRSRIIAFAILVLALTPLIYGFVRQPDLVKQWLLIPAQLPEPYQIAKNFAWGISTVLLISNHLSDLSLGRLPLLNAVQIGLMLFGAYVIFVRLKLTFFWLLLSSLVVLVFYSLNPRFEILLTGLPFFAFLSGMGLRYLYLEWRKVFPKNPLAKTFAISLMAAVVAIHTFFGIRYSLVAWPATPHVKQTYVLK